MFPVLQATLDRLGRGPIPPTVTMSGAGVIGIPPARSGTHTVPRWPSQGSWRDLMPPSSGSGKRAVRGEWPV